MRIYIAHPYTGDEERNRERALKAEEMLRKATPHARFFNPVGRLSEQYEALSYVEVMTRCLEALAECDGIVLCGAWETSPGCRIEMNMARRLQKTLWFGVDSYTQGWARVAEVAREEEALE